ncbi:MAG: PEP-CTERM sorting domain-containing protein [Candidatus Solibacter sp.]
MTRRKLASRSAVPLPELDHRLAAYALVAGAALTSVPAAQASVVHVINPSPNSLSVNGVSSSGLLGTLQFFTVSGLPSVPDDTPLFNLGIAGLLYGASSNPSFAALTLFAYGQPSNYILRRGSWVANLAPGSYIGCGGCASSGFWSSGGPMMFAFKADSYYGPHLDGPWANRVGIMGFSFGTWSSYFFGWARFQVDGNTDSPGISVRLLDYAYENQPFTGIHAGDTGVPEPGTLGLLALGFAGMAAWRARRKAA